MDALTFGDFTLPVQWRSRAPGQCIAIVPELGLIGAGEDECAALKDLARSRNNLLTRVFSELVRERMPMAKPRQGAVAV